MSESCDVEACATAVMAARREVRVLPQWPSRAPGAFWETYAIHAAAARLPGHDLTGWKVGNLDAPAQAKSGIPVVTNAPLLAPWTKAAPATFARKDFLAPRLECEFAFALARDLPARKVPYSRDEVAEAVAALHPAIEIVDTRRPGGRPLEALADCMASGGFVYGAGVRDWRRFEIGSHPMTLAHDGRVVTEGSGAAILGDPFAALVLLANNPPPWTTLAAGHIVTTGSCIFPHAAEATGTYVADFGALGKVSLTLT